jgi:hypothetical protein
MQFHPTFEIPVVLIELAAIGSHYAFPELPHTLGLVLFWGGLGGLLLWFLWIGWRFLRAPGSNAPARDVSVGEAISYVCFRHWGRRFVDAAGDRTADVNASLTAFCQAAADDRITIWGKTTSGAVFEKIPADFWRKNQIEWFGLLRREPATESTDPAVHHGLAPSIRYSDLMTSRTQVEAAWPKRRRWLVLRKPWEVREV